MLAADPGNGFVEVCKAASGPGVAGSFDFAVGGRTVSVPVGACSAPIQLPSGTATVTEAAQPGMVVTDIHTGPAARLVSRDLANRSARIAVPEGDVSSQTVVTFTNTYETGQLKVCKVAGPGVTVGTNASFLVDTRALTVPAGPAPGGYCGLAGTFPAGTEVAVNEIVSPGSVSAITVTPSDRLSGTVDLAGRRATVIMGIGATEVTFTNQQTSATTTTTPTPTSTTVPGCGVLPTTVVAPTTVPITALLPTTTTTVPGGGVVPTTRLVAPTSTIPGLLPTTTLPGATTTTVASVLPTSTVPGASTTTIPAVGATTTVPHATTTTGGPTTTSGTAPTTTAARTTHATTTLAAATVKAASTTVNGGRLARTGPSTARLALWGLALLLLGVALVQGAASGPRPALPPSLVGLWESVCRPTPIDDDPEAEAVDDFAVALADPPFLDPSPSWSSAPDDDGPRRPAVRSGHAGRQCVRATQAPVLEGRPG